MRTRKNEKNIPILNFTVVWQENNATDSHNLTNSNNAVNQNDVFYTDMCKVTAQDTYTNIILVVCGITPQSKYS